MKNKKISLMIVRGISAVIFVVFSMFIYVNYVQDSLWDKSINDILETTSQEEKAFNVYMTKEMTNSQNILTNIAYLQTKIPQYLQHLSNREEAKYLYIDYTNDCYYDENGNYPLGDEQLFQQIKADNNSQGFLEPYLNSKTGIKTFATYVKTSDSQSVIVKETQLSFIIENFSLSFYNDLGFSYIVKDNGEILIRSKHRNSNRTFKNLFDLIDLSGNDAKTIESFKASLSKRDKGVALFNYQDSSNVFCYVPLQQNNHWFIISIIPNSVIMKQANNIIISSIILCSGIAGAISCVVLLYIRDSRKHKRMLENLAFYDHLTMLYNYQKFKTEGEKLFLERNHTLLAVLYLDINDFKIINELYGYKYGDKILTQLANILKKLVIAPGLTCRVNADNFLIMQSYHDKTELENLCQEINQKFCNLLESLDNKNNTIVKIGICCYEDDQTISGIDGLIDCSHLALNAYIPGQTNNYYFYNSKMHDQMIRKVEIENNMESALLNNEFTFYLQPKYAPNGQVMLGAEALVRWLEPSGNLIMPGEFIPIFEQNGFILKMDEYIFESVCKFLYQRIIENLPNVPISINISRLHLYQDDFIERYSKIKNKYSLPDKLVELEITENILLDNIERIRNIIIELQNNGFTCSIDDFGSGYSSLNSLKDLPFEVIKLDRFFLINSYDIQRSQEIIKAIVEMAKTINIKTVAEGVETPSQLEFLKMIDCDMIQGYIFSKPRPIKEFEQLLINQEK